MPHHGGARIPPAHLADELSVRTNLKQLDLPVGDYWPLKPVHDVHLDDHGQLP